jgi:hypothetical protein
MRKSAHGALLVLTSLLAAVALSIASAFAAALAFGAIALVVPGTGTPNANLVGGYLENARDRFIDPSGEDICTTAGCLTGVNYPASFWPVPLPGWCPGLRCDTWNASVGEGVEHLMEAIDAAPADEDIVVFGYSQGGAVVSRAMYLIDPADRSRIRVVTIGNINNPQGLWSRFSFLPTIPGLNISFNPQLPTNNGITSTNYTFEYDPVGDAPLYWGNPLAVLNALAGFVYVHGYYLDPTAKSPDDTLPYGYDPDTFPDVIDNLPGRTYGNATFVLIPHRGPLPLFLPFVEIGQETGTSQFIDPFIRLLNPVTKVLVDLGYDRTMNPGIPRTLSPLPFNPFAINPVDLTVRIVGAIGQGIYDATHGTPLFPPNVAPSTNDTLVSARTSGEPTSELVPVVKDNESETQGELPTDSKLEDVSTQPVVTTPVGGADLTNGGGTDGDLKQDDLEQDELNQDDVKQDDDLKQEDPKEDDVKEDDLKQDDVKQDEVKQDDPGQDVEQGGAGNKPATEAAGAENNEPAAAAA